MTPRFRFLTVCFFSIAVLTSTLFLESRAQAQTAGGKNDNAGPTWDSTFIPDDAFAVILASPRELLQNDAFTPFPIELLQVQFKETFGIEPSQISIVKLVLGMQEDGQPAFGVVLEMTQPFEQERLLESLQAEADPNDVAETATFAINVGPPGTVLHMVDDKTILLTLQTYLEAMLAAEQGTGKLPSFVAATPRATGINLMLALDSIRPVISDFVAQQAQALPPELLPLTDLPELIDTAYLNVSFNNNAGKLTLAMAGIDDDASARIDEIVTDGLIEGPEILIEVLKQSMPGRTGSEELEAAAGTYAERLTKQIFGTISSKRTGNDVTMVVDTELGVAGGVIVANLLLPMDLMMGSLTRQFDSLNNLRMVMLAMHNYHAAYNRLPGPAIMSADGKPLLSWRVALLPFLEEQALYEQFRLDEPWDSEHNLPLSKRLPKVYSTAGVRLPPGQTVVHAAVGDEIGMRPKGNTGFRDFPDGLSNTIMILESNADSAVPWSKPADVEIDLEDPLAKFKGSPKKSFGVGLGDGVVKRYPDDIDVAKFKALLTRAGREIVEH